MTKRYNDKKIYTAEDIQQYFQGNLSPAEMHEMEKAAIQDPFLADAMEGYAEIDPAIVQKKLNEIHSALYGEQFITLAESKRKPRQWMIAASIILLMGAAATGWLLRNTASHQTQTAQRTSLPGAAKKDSVSTPPKAAITAQNNAPVPKTHFNKQKAEKEEQLARTKATESAMLMNKEKEITASLTKKENYPAPVLYDSVNTTLALANPVTINQMQTGKIAGISVNPEKKEAGDRLFYKDKQVAIPADSLALGKVSFTARTVADSLPLTALTEVVVTGYGTQRKKDITGSVTNQKSTPAPILPDGGWPALHTYLLSKLGDTPIPHGSFLVELTVKNGKLIKANILTSSIPSLNSKLTKALKKGPKWTGPFIDSEKTKHQVTISL
ncbi:MAG: hypothetical protein V4450_06930 [Bacteroidota bacterium]